MNWRKTTAAAAMAAVIAPFAMAMAKVANTRWHPTWDIAAIFLLAKDVGTVHTPLVGPYSRFGWNHPGPLLFYAIAPFVRLFGANGLLIGSAFICLASLVVGIVVVERCLGRSYAIAAALTGLLLCIGLTPDVIVSPWNPTVPILPFFTCALAAWADLYTRGRALIVSVVFGSFAAQCHTGFVPLVVALWLLEIAIRILDHRRNPGRGQRSLADRIRALPSALWIGLVLWVPPLYQMLSEAPGNLSRIIVFFGEHNGAIYGYMNAAKSMSLMVSARFPWITGHDQSPATGFVSKGSIVEGGLVTLVVVVIALAAHRLKNRRLSTLCVVVLTLIFVGWLTMAHITDGPLYYLTRWAWIIGALTWIAILFGGIWLIRLGVRTRAPRHTMPTTRPRVSLTAVWSLAGTTGIIVCGIVLTVSAWNVQPPAPKAGEVVSELSDEAAPHLRRNKTYLARWSDPDTFDPFAVGILAALEVAGYHVYFSEGAPIVGAHRIRPVDDTDEEIQVIASHRACGAAIPPGWTPIACTEGRGAQAPARTYALAIRETP